MVQISSTAVDLMGILAAKLNTCQSKKELLVVVGLGLGKKSPYLVSKLVLQINSSAAYKNQFGHYLIVALEYDIWLR